MSKVDASAVRTYAAAFLQGLVAKQGINFLSSNELNKRQLMRSALKAGIIALDEETKELELLESSNATEVRKADTGRTEAATGKSTGRRKAQATRSNHSDS